MPNVVNYTGTTLTITFFDSSNNKLGIYTLPCAISNTTVFMPIPAGTNASTVSLTYKGRKMNYNNILYPNGYLYYGFDGKFTVCNGQQGTFTTPYTAANLRVRSLGTTIKDLTDNKYDITLKDLYIGAQNDFEAFIKKMQSKVDQYTKANTDDTSEDTTEDAFQVSMLIIMIMGIIILVAVVVIIALVMKYKPSIKNDF